MGIYGNAFSNMNSKMSILESGVLQIEKEYNNFSKITESFSILTESNIILEFSIKDIFKKIGEFFRFLGRKIKELWEKIFGKKKSNEDKLKKAEDNLKKAEEKKASGSAPQTSNSNETPQASNSNNEDKKESGVVDYKTQKMIKYKYFLSFDFAGHSGKEELTEAKIKECIDGVMSSVGDISSETVNFDIKKQIKEIENGSKTIDSFMEDITDIQNKFEDEEARYIIGTLKLINFKDVLKLEKESVECSFDEFMTYYTGLVKALKNANEIVFTNAKSLIDDLNKRCNENAAFCEFINEIKVKDKDGNVAVIDSEGVKAISEGFKVIGNMIKDCDAIVLKAQNLVSEYIADIEHDSVLKFA